MMEQKENEHLVFTNEMPSWKIKLSYVFAGIFLILGVIILYFSWDFTQFRDGWDIFAFILIGGLGFFFCILPFYLIKTMKRRLKIHTKEELRNDGYHFFYYDEFTKNQYHLNMPFENMEFVLISLGLFEISQSYVDADGDVEKQRIKKVFAKIHIMGTLTEGNEKIVGISIDKKDTFDVWMNLFQQNDVPIYYTEYGLNHISLTKELFNDIPMKPYEGRLPFTIGKALYDPYDELEFLTDGQKDKHKKTRKYIRLLTLVLGLIQIPIVSLWLPHIEIENAIFDSDLYGAIWVFTIFALLFANLPRLRRRWYEPLIDITKVIVGVIIGTLFIREATEEFYDALFLNYFAIVFLYLAVIYFSQFRNWIRQKLQGSPQ